MANQLSGKTAAVTGSASGIGRASAEMMLAEGATVVFVDRDEKALDAICARHEKAIPLVFDLLNVEECKTLLPKLLELVGHLDIFHANAGSYIGGDLVDADTDAIDRMLNLNVNVVMKNVHDVLPHMIERKVGDIIWPVRWPPITRRRGSPSTPPPSGRSIASSKPPGARSLSTASGSAAFRRGRSSPACSRTGPPKNFRKPRTPVAWSKPKRSPRSFSSCSHVRAT